METAKLTVRLPKKHLEFAERYARARRITVSMLFDELLRHLQGGDQATEETKAVEADGWQKLFQVGDEIAATDSSDSPTLTSAVSAMRR